MPFRGTGLVQARGRNVERAESPSRGERDACPRAGGGGDTQGAAGVCRRGKGRIVEEGQS